jgi:N-acetylneuraminate synthase
MAIPLLQGQLSCRELIAGEVLATDLRAGAPVTLEAVDTPYSRVPAMRARVNSRGLPQRTNGKAGVAV